MPTLTPIEAVEAVAMKLSPAERALLVERLLASLDVDPEVDAAWAEEVERREAQIESGEATWIDGPEAIAMLKSRFQ